MSVDQERYNVVLLEGNDITYTFLSNVDHDTAYQFMRTNWDLWLGQGSELALVYCRSGRLASFVL